MSISESIALRWDPPGSFHHVGFVVSSIQAVAHSFARSIAAAWDGHIIHDPNQAVRVSFLQSSNASDPLIELIEPAGDESPVSSFLKSRGGGLHHVCYVVDCLEKQLEKSRVQGDLIVRLPLPAAAFGGRRIAWVYTKAKLVVEYLETRHAGQG